MSVEEVAGGDDSARPAPPTRRPAGPRRGWVTRELLAASMSVSRRGPNASDGTHVGRNVFAVADGIDTVAGSGADALLDVIRLLGMVSRRPSWHGVLRATNSVLWQRGSPDGGIGAETATVTAALWTGSRFVIGHLGDSRAYLVRAGEARLVTEDHVSRPGAARAAGVDGSDDCVVRLGQGPNVQGPDVVAIPAEGGDRLVLCTDGLWRTLTAAALATAVDAPPDVACDRLAAHAAAHADEDASAVVIAVQAHRGATRAASHQA